MDKNSEIIRAMLEGKEVVKFPPYARVIMSPISRNLWVQLPEDVRLVLENEHGYSHYDVTTDSIKTLHRRHLININKP